MVGKDEKCNDPHMNQVQIPMGESTRSFKAKGLPVDIVHDACIIFKKRFLLSYCPSPYLLVVQGKGDKSFSQKKRIDDRKRGGKDVRQNIFNVKQEKNKQET